MDVTAAHGAEGGPAPAHSCRLAPVAPGVWTATSTTWTSVSTLVVAQDGGVLVVDPNVDPSDLAVLVAEVAAHGWTPVAGFSTHPHWDHVLWPTAWGGVVRWATPDGAREAHEHRGALVEEAEEVAPGHDHAGTGLLTALAGETLPWAGPTAVVVPYPGHCPGSAALWLPDARVLVTGDVLSDREIPLLAEPSAREPDPVGAYRAGLDVLASVPAQVLVPGHGTVTGAEGMQVRLDADRAYLDRLGAGDGVVDMAAPDARLRDPEQAEHHARQVVLAARLLRSG